MRYSLALVKEKGQRLPEPARPKTLGRATSGGAANRDYSRTYNEHFDGFVVGKFNGDRVKISGGEVWPL